MNLQLAARLFESARFGEAEDLCRQVLAVNPRQVDALNLLGLCSLQLGYHEHAVEVLQRAVKLAPGNVGALANLGSALQAAGREDEALAKLQKAASLMPASADLRYNVGNALRRLGRHDEAIRSYGQALKIQPTHVGALSNRGDTLRELRRREEALSDFDAAVALASGDARMSFNRGVVLQELGRTVDAIASYEHALRLRPDYAEAAHNLGLALKELKRLDEALARFDRALALRDDYPEARQARGNALLDLGRLSEALDNIDRSLLQDPHSVEGHVFRGGLLRKLGRNSEAVEAYDRALAVEPDHVPALINRSAALLGMNDVEQALEGNRRVSALHPDNSMAHWNEALCLLLSGDFVQGWRKYEWRWKRWAEDGVNNGPLHADQSIWLGEGDLSGRTILLHAEQGIGDSLQFCRYVPLLAQRGARVIFEVQAFLMTLMERLPGVERVTAMYSPQPPCNVHTPLMSLPLAFGTTLDSIPDRVPYLSADPKRCEQWRQRLDTGASRPRIGVAWRGNPGFARDATRSMALEMLAPLAQLGVDLISLQKDIAEADLPHLELIGVRQFGSYFQDFSDTAALIDSLDLVIAVDTAVAHLAGALAKPVWILLPFAPDWRWLLGRTDSPWYPTARLFRQARGGDWLAVVAELAAALRERFGLPGQRRDNL